MLVGRRMTKNPVTVGPEDDLHAARAKMREGRFRRLPVTVDGKLIGMITDRDMRPHLESVECKHVKEIMTPEPKSVAPETSVEQAAEILLSHKIGGLPVLDAGRLVGIITTRDILEAFLDHWDGYGEGAARIDIVSDQDKFDIAGALTIIAEQGAKILGLGAYRERWNESPVFYVRFRSASAEHMAEVLTTKGYNVLGVHFS